MLSDQWPRFAPTMGQRWELHSYNPPTVVISPLSTRLLPNFRALLIHRHGATVSLESKPFVRLIIHTK